MRRGGLAQALQHARQPSSFGKLNLCSTQSFASAASRSLLVSSNLRGNHINPHNSDRLSASISCRSACGSSSPDCGVLKCAGYQIGRRFTSACCLSSNWNWREGPEVSSSSGLIWGSIGSCLDSSRQFGGPQQKGSSRRTRLATMAASSAAKGSGDGAVPEGYRPNVGLCLVNEKDEVFVASRLDVPESWQMPQGGVDKGEEPRSAAIRELREETGVTSVQLIGEVPEWLTYDFPQDVKIKITKLWGKEWTGQAQKWFLFRFTGEDSEINLEGDGSEKPEFGEWKWLPAQEVIENAVDFKKPVYAQAFKSLSMYIHSWSKL